MAGVSVNSVTVTYKWSYQLANVKIHNTPNPDFHYISFQNPVFSLREISGFPYLAFPETST
jgi:hypothetical protein